MPKHGRPSSRSKEQYMYNSPLTAPFGTLFSGNSNIRIVGGKYVSDERHNGDAMTASLENGLGGASTNRSQAQFHSPAAQEKTDLLNSNMPGGAGSMNPHRVLPSIGSYRDMDETDHYHHHADKGGTFVGRPVDICDVYDKLPRDSMVSLEPLMLPDDERLAVMREIKRELNYIDISLLNRVYAELQRADNDMSGYLPFQELMMALNRNQITLPSRLLRLVACMFVSRIEPGTVGYHNILSFISNALSGSYPSESNGVPPQEDQMRANVNTTYGQSFERPLLLKDQYKAMTQGGNYHEPMLHPQPIQNPYPKSQSPQHMYYHMTREDWSPNSNAIQVSPRGDLQRTLRQLQSRLPESVNLENLRNAFQRADRYHRGTLSEAQIREICADCLRLDREVVDTLITGIPARGGGQYNWQSFIDLMERVLPISTTLNIPASKRPLEYARALRQPASNWPAPSPSPPPPPAISHRQQPPPASMPPYRHEYLSETPPPVPPAVPQDAIQQRQPGLYREDTFRSADLNAYHQAPNYMEPSGVIPPVDATYPNPMENTGEPWSERFMKLANLIYRNDQQHVGMLEEDKIRWLTRECNSVCNLNLSEGAIADALSKNRKNGGVNIHGYLSCLVASH